MVFPLEGIKSLSTSLPPRLQLTGSRAPPPTPALSSSSSSRSNYPTRRTGPSSPPLAPPANECSSDEDLASEFASLEEEPDLAENSNSRLNFLKFRLPAYGEKKVGIRSVVENPPIGSLTSSSASGKLLLPPLDRFGL
ncbi:unnamed protein product [Dovyalis caffra]|uniref:Uncharacterized protein n=1 Tax=Dovyalis caffra TaxID=77055 RepID=A0AAV1R8X1_9ROSI|nr:unnamed protein product [Dovyalis caffra]